MSLPGVTLVTVEYGFVDLNTATGTIGRVRFYPAATVTVAGDVIVDGRRPRVGLIDPVTGLGSVQLPATDDTDLNPTLGHYRVVEPSGATYSIVVPAATVGPLQLADLRPVGESPAPLTDASVRIRQAIDYDDTTPPETGQAIVWDGDAYAPGIVTGGGGASSLADLDDVDTSAAAVGQLLAVADDDPLGFELIDAPTGYIGPRGVPGRRLAMLGDSIVAGVIGQATPSANNVLQGSCLLYGCMQSDGRLEWGGQFGVPGNTSAQALARVDQVIADAPDMCLVLIGTNDPDLTTLATNLPQIVAGLLAAGVEPVLATLPPSSRAYSGNEGVHRLIRRMNQWISRYATQHQLRLVDFFGALVDPATGLYRTGHNSDVTHPNQTGYRVMGKVLADALSPQVQAGTSWLVSDPLNETGIFTNGLFLTDTGSDGLPDSWYIAAAGTGTTQSLVTDPDFVGNAWKVDRTDTSTRVYAWDLGSFDWTFQPGDRVAVSFKLTTEGVEAAGAIVSVGASNNGKTSGPTDMVSVQVGADIDAGVFYFESIVPPGTTGTQVAVRSYNGNGQPYSYKIGQFAIRSLTEQIGVPA